MAKFCYVIKDEAGIHARPAGALAKLVKSRGSHVTITKGDKSIDITRLMAVMALGVKQGDEVTIESDDETMLEEVRQFFEENL